LAAATVLSPSLARADDFLEFENARQAYEAGTYEEAVTRFERLVGGDVPLLTDPVYILESRKYLAAAYVMSRRPEPAERQFELLVREEPRYTIDSASFPREVVTLFQTVRDRVVEQRQQEEEQRRIDEERRRQEALEALIRDRERLARLEELARTETVTSESNRLVALAPFGTGQFLNGNDTLGWFFAITEGVLVAGSIASFLVWESIDPDNYPEDPAAPERNNQEFADAEEAWRLTNWVVSGTLLVTAIVGIVEAQLSFQPEVRYVRSRELPPDLTPEEEDDPPESEADLPAASLGLELRVSPFGLSLRF
jgi:hypothetical protein